MMNFVSSLMHRPSIRDRRFPRLTAELPAELYFPERKFGLTGMLIEISRGGALFREASPYILDRRRSAVVLRVGLHEIPGVIVNVRPAGYGIRFDEIVSEDVVAELSAVRGDAVS